MSSEKKKCCACQSGVSGRFHATELCKNDMKSCLALGEDREGFLCGTCMCCVSKYRKDRSLNFKHRVDCKVKSKKNTSDRR